jgi:hypothetical protein
VRVREAKGDAMTMTTDRLTQAIDALAKRIEPRMSRHPVTVVQHAGSVIARIGEAIDCQFEDGDDLVAGVKELVRERDEARAGAERWKASLKAFREDYWAEGSRWLEKAHARAEEAETELNRLRSFAKPWEGDAYRRGAEAMREACQQWCRAWENNGDAIADALADLRVEEP